MTDAAPGPAADAVAAVAAVRAGLAVGTGDDPAETLTALAVITSATLDAALGSATADEVLRKIGLAIALRRSG